jgi:hypothetical protein
MSAFRLLAVAVLILLCAGVAVAQARSADAVPDGAPTNQFQISPYPRIDFVSQDGSAVGSHALHGDQDAERAKDLAEREAFRDLVDSQLPTCYTIRSYVVVRDDPHSDSTHHDSATTCVAASRFKVYTSDRMPNLKIVWGR